MAAQAMVLEFGMGVDVHGDEGTKAACRAVSDAIRHSSLPLFTEVRAKGGRMLVDVTVGVPDPGETAVTVAVSVTDWPKTDGFTDELRAVELLA